MTRRRWLGLGAALAVLLTAAVLARGPQPAVAVTTPADGASVPILPTEVDLGFTAAVDEFHVSARDAGGTPVTVGQAYPVAPDRLRQPISVAAPGVVTVVYHVTFAGGGTVSGTLRFGVGGATVVGAGPVAEAHGHAVDPLSAVLLILDGAVAVGAVLLLVLRPPPRRTAAGHSPRSGGRRRDGDPGAAAVG